MNRVLAGFALAFLLCPAAEAATVSKTYSYFSIGGSTLEEIEAQLASRGPQVKTSGQRHPGATQMEFTTRVGYARDDRGCSVASAAVAVKAKVILPRWKRSRRADNDVRLIWDTLAADIKRHEESHIVIAKNHARDLEQSIKAIGRQPSCERAAALAKERTDRILAQHDRAQAEFDRVEGMNFESRLIRLLRYRLERMGAAGG